MCQKEEKKNAINDIPGSTDKNEKQATDQKKVWYPY